jgi:hypothetical protein
MRGAVDQAKAATNQARDTSANLGATASGIGSNLIPFETSQLEHPQGFSQADESAMLAAGEAGAGGADAGIVGEAAQRAAVSRNAGGFQAALGEAARERAKAAAGTSEGIAAQNATLKTQQQADAAKALERMYGVDTSGMLDASGQESSDINAQVNANNSGWLQNATGVINSLAGAYRAYKGH